MKHHTSALELNQRQPYLPLISFFRSDRNDPALLINLLNEHLSKTKDLPHLERLRCLKRKLLWGSSAESHRSDSVDHTQSHGHGDHRGPSNRTEKLHQSNWLMYALITVIGSSPLP